MTSKLANWMEIAGSVALAIAAEPIHEAGHAVAARLLTGVWPEMHFWAVHPNAPIHTNAAVLSVLAAGDAAVIAWWALVLLICSRRPNRTWALIGPTFMVGLALLNWLAAAILTPFGYGHLGASDAVKFIAVSGLRPWLTAAVVAGIVLVIAITTAKAVPVRQQVSAWRETRYLP